MTYPDITTFISDQMKPCTYLCVGSLEPTSSAYMRPFKAHVRDVGTALAKPEFEHQILRICYASDPRRYCNRIGFTVKTHKPRGEVSFRLLHDGSGHPWRGLSKALAVAISSSTSTLPRLCKSTQEFVSGACESRSVPNFAELTSLISTWQLARRRC